VQIPHGTGFVGINSMIRHSVAANPYSDVRIGAFMGKKIIKTYGRARDAGRWIILRNFRWKNSGHSMPVRCRKNSSGQNFLRSTRRMMTPVTKIQPDALTVWWVRRGIPSRRTSGYCVSWRRCTRRSMARKNRSWRRANGMYGAHEGYRDNCRLSTDEVDFLVESVRKRGPKTGLYGAR